MKKLVGIVLFIILMRASIVWFQTKSNVPNKATYSLLFQNIGGLKVGDNVSVNGLSKGRVTKIYLHEAEIAVDIEIDKAVPFTDSSTVKVQSIGLMGEREIGIALSHLGSRYTPNTETSVNYISGQYEIGISESIGQVGKLFRSADTILTVIEKLENIGFIQSPVESDSINSVEISITINDNTYSATATSEELNDALDSAITEVKQKMMTH